MKRLIASVVVSATLVAGTASCSHKDHAANGPSVPSTTTIPVPSTSTPLSGLSDERWVVLIGLPAITSLSQATTAAFTSIVNQDPPEGIASWCKNALTLVERGQAVPRPQDKALATSFFEALKNMQIAMSMCSDGIPFANETERSQMQDAITNGKKASDSFFSRIKALGLDKTPTTTTVAH